MEVEEIQTQGHKFRRIGNGDGRIEQNKKGEEQFGDEEEDDEIKRRSNGGSGGGGGGLDFSSGGRLYGWPSSRIVRVSRASGGKDRHSKVLTSKGLRDRRVRLSVNTAIQFYDLQDRLGYDQPSKAVEWLLKAAASSISELPPISTLLPDASKQLSDEKSFDSPQVEMEIGPNCLTQQQQQQAALPKSACSSNSENSKGSGTLSLSRSESRIKARERARERAKAAEKEKDKENESTTLVFQQHDQLSQNLNPPISQNAASFTELLTSGMNGHHHNNSNSNSNHNNSTTSPTGSVGEANFFHKSPRQYSTPMDYFATGLLGPVSSTRATHGFSGQLHLGSPLQQAPTTVSSPLFTFNGDQHHHHHHQELPQFSFVQDHFIPVVTTAAAGNNGGGSNNNNNNNNSNNNEYNLNFTISSSSSSGLAGFSRGTLQSNSSTPSLLPHIQRFASIDGSPSTFFIGAAAPQPNAAVPPVENHHHHLIPEFDAGLQLCYRDGGRHSDQKGKGKS